MNFFKRWLQNDAYAIFYKKVTQKDVLPLNPLFLFRELNLLDLERSEIFNERNRKSRYQTRLQDGHKAFVVIDRNQVVSYFWVAAPKWGAMSAPFEYTYQFFMQPNEAYIWDCRTKMEYQNIGLYAYGLNEVMQRLYRSQIQHAWIVSNVYNYASVRGIAHAGFKLKGTIKILVFAGLKFLKKNFSGKIEISSNRKQTPVTFSGLTRWDPNTAAAED